MTKTSFLRSLVATLTGRKLSRDTHLVPGDQSVAGQDVGRFFLVAGIGHCGTAWLATVLNRPYDRMVCYHEHKNAVTGLDWKASLMHEFEHGLDGRFEAYWRFMRQQMRRFQVVGDSNAWTMYMIPEVDSKIEVDQVIYLVRNGIQNVHSGYYHNESLPRSDWIYTHFYRRYWEMLDQPGGDWDEYSVWACRCFWWQLNAHMPSWLADKLGKHKVTVHRFEDLLASQDQLYGLIRDLNPEVRVSPGELVRAQATDTNRKIRGDRSPTALWSKWGSEQRRIFQRICGPGMAHYGYEVPEP